MTMTRSIANCLAVLHLSDPTLFDNAENLDEEFQLIKQNYHQRILQTHPDKNPNTDGTDFRNVRASFGIVKELYSNDNVKNNTFATYLAKDNVDEADDGEYNRYFSSENVPSWDFYQAAADEEMPGYKVEGAVSGRSKCTTCKKPALKKRGKKKKGEEEAEAAPVADAAVEAAAVVSAATTRGQPEIVKGEIRVGSLDDRSGAYGRWHHLRCWRVPKKIWQGLTDATDADVVLQDLLNMNEVLLTGVNDLDDEQRTLFVAHASSSSNWASYDTWMKQNALALTAAAAAGDDNKENKQNRLSDQEDGEEDKKPPAKRARTTKKKSKPSPGLSSSNADASASTVASGVAKGSTSAVVVSSNAVVKTNNRFVIPKPGIGLAIVNKLEGKTFVMSGIFPEVGGGRGLTLGKAKVKAMIEAFGGRCTSAISGKTNFLLLGKEPGASKYNQATARGIPIIELCGLTALVNDTITFEQIEAAPAVEVQSFSKGYKHEMLE